MLRLGLSLVATIIILISVTTGCKEKEAERLKIVGTITDSSTGELISGTEVLLEAQILTNGTFNNNFQTLASAVSDGSGSFQIEVEKQNFNDVRLTYSKTDYLQLIEVINPDVLSADPTDFSQSLDPIAFVNLRLINSNPSNDQDEITFRYTTASFPQCACCNNAPRTFFGTDVDTLLTCPIVGNTQLEYLYFVIKNGSETVITDGVYVESFETTEIVINY